MFFLHWIRAEWLHRKPLTVISSRFLLYRRNILFLQLSKDLSEEYERLVNPEKALEDSKSPKIKVEAMSDIPFPVSEEPEADLASGDQALPMGVLGANAERLASGLDGDHSPHTSGKIILIKCFLPLGLISSNFQVQ